MKNQMLMILFASDKQRQCYNILLLILFLLLPGCGGGGVGVYSAINTIDLHKTKLSQTEISSYQRQFFPVTCDDIPLRSNVLKEGEKIFGTCGYFQKVNFLGVEYYLHSNYYLHGVDFIRKSDMKKILLLPVPKYVYAFSAFEVTMSNKKFLVVYVEQQPPSNTSTLFVINSQFNIVYQEHLLGALEIGPADSVKYGNCIVLKSENCWFPDDRNKPQVKINGDWLYYLPKESKKAITTTGGKSD